MSKAYWCDGHLAVELMDDPDEDRKPGCLLQGPFYSYGEARQFALKFHDGIHVPQEPIDRTEVPADVLDMWATLLGDDDL
jgi:hypothetical protein